MISPQRKQRMTQPEFAAGPSLTLSSRARRRGICCCLWLVTFDSRLRFIPCHPEAMLFAEGSCVSSVAHNADHWQLTTSNWQLPCHPERRDASRAGMHGESKDLCISFLIHGPKLAIVLRNFNS